MANLDDLPMTDFTRWAAWKATVLSTRDYLRMSLALREFISMLFSFAGFTLEMIVINLMHVSDLGILLYLIGNIPLELHETIHKEGERNSDTAGTIYMFMCMSAQWRNAGVTPRARQCGLENKR